MKLTDAELAELIELDGLQREQTDAEYKRAYQLYNWMNAEQEAAYRAALLPKEV